MKRTLVSAALPGALALVFTLAAADARAEPAPRAADVERAEAYAADAYDAYQRKDYASAVALYRKAYEAAPTADILFNIARIYDIGLGDRSLAMLFYQDYVVDPEAEDDRIEVAFERIGQLQAAERAANEQHSAPPPSPPSAAPAPVTAPVRARPSADVELIEPSAPWTSLRVGGIVAGTVGLVSIGIGAGFGVAALSDASTAREYCDGDVCSSQRGVDAVHSATKSADIATVSFALGGALVAVGGLLLWLDDGPSSPADSAQDTRADTAQLAWSPIASQSELGLALSGSW
jgi:tetratricopeptide (TPR) repeat protein